MEGPALTAKLVPGGKAHVVKFSVHDLRHFHASLMIEQGMQPKQLQEHMGHSSIKVTMDIYGHLFKDEEAKARRRALIVGSEETWLPVPGAPIPERKSLARPTAPAILPPESAGKGSPWVAAPQNSHKAARNRG